MGVIRFYKTKKENLEKLELYEQKLSEEKKEETKTIKQ